MSEESQEGGMSTIKKTIIGLVTTIATAAGAYITTQFNEIFGVEEEEKTEEVTPAQQTQAPAPIILNVDNSTTNSNLHLLGEIIIIVYGIPIYTTIY